LLHFCKFLVGPKTILPGDRGGLAWTNNLPQPGENPFTDLYLAVHNVRIDRCFQSLGIAVSADRQSGRAEIKRVDQLFQMDAGVHGGR
jgi:hypothetical protein